MVNITEAKGKILAHNMVNQYVDITPYELHVGFPIVNYTGFFPQPNELIIYAVPASIFKDKEQVVGYTGKSTGASFRVAKGVTVRTGGSGGRAVRDTVRKHSFGDLIITNQRVIFIGKDDNFDFPINKITAIKPLSKETFVVQAGRSSKNIFVEPGAVLYATGFVNYAITCNNEGLDVNAEKKQAEDEMTDEQINLCNQIKQEILATPQPKPKPQKKKWGCFTKFMFGVMCFFLAILIGVISFVIYIGVSGNSIDSDGNIISAQKYSDKEILDLENHPKAFDNFENTKDFYSKVSSKKVRIYNTYKNGGAYTKEENFLMYIDNGASRNDYVSDIRINLSLSEEFKDVTLDDVIRMAVSYLPMDIMDKYYDVNRVFTYGNEETMGYHYSWRLNKDGVDYYNSGHHELYNDYGFVIVHNIKTNDYTIKINLWARDVNMVGHDDEWIEKNTEPWNINLNTYYEN